MDLKLPLILRSRTTYTVLANVLINAIPQVRQYFSPATMDSVTAVLGVIAVLFHVNPSQEYSTRSQIAAQPGATALGVPPVPPKL